MDIVQVRQRVKELYPGSKRWSWRVDLMSDSQVFAIYKSKIEKGETPGESRKEKDDEFPF